MMSILCMTFCMCANVRIFSASGSGAALEGLQLGTIVGRQWWQRGHGADPGGPWITQSRAKYHVLECKIYPAVYDTLVLKSLCYIIRNPIEYRMRAIQLRGNLASSHHCPACSML